MLAYIYQTVSLHIILNSPFLLTLLDRLHFVSTPDVALQNDDALVLMSRRKPVFNPVFVIGTVLFAASMVLKANVNDKWAAIPLAIASLILISGVWLLSANGQVIFDRRELKVYRVYKHLGYVQRVYTTPLQSVDNATLFETKNAGLHLQLDNMNTLLICKLKVLKGNGNALVAHINAYLRR
jgi:hypothetical protein